LKTNPFLWYSTLLMLFKKKSTTLIIAFSEGGLIVCVGK
jgi:hypothetical protein